MSALPEDYVSSLLEPHGHFSLSVRAACYGVNRIPKELAPRAGHPRYGFIHGVNRAVAIARVRHLFTVNLHLKNRDRRLFSAAYHVEFQKPEAVRHLYPQYLFLHYGLDVLVEHLFFPVGKALEPLERLVQISVAELVAHLLQPLPEGVPSGVLAHNERGAGNPDRFRTHYLVGGLLF